MGYQVCLWHVMDDGADSVSLLDALLERYTQPSVDFCRGTKSGPRHRFFSV